MRGIRALELFSGIGGFSESLRALGPAASGVEVVAAVEMAPHLMEAYGENFPGAKRLRKNLLSLPTKALAKVEADLWWMSPPCQPFTTRGLQRGLDDPRAQILPRLMAWIEELAPAMVGMENVPGFSGSRAHEQLMATLEQGEYEVEERLLCPTELGIPARRERYYLVARRGGLPERGERRERPARELLEFLDQEPDDDLRVPAEVLAKYEKGMRILDLEADPGAIANTFTSAYGKSWRASGSYLRIPDGGARFLSPREILRVMGFSEEFRFPEGFTRRRAYKAVGNSLSVFAMQEVLSRLLGAP